MNALIFDFDGTLIDSKEAIIESYKTAINKVKPEYIDLIKKIPIGPSLDEVLRIIFNDVELIKQIKKEFIKVYDKKIIPDTKPYLHAETVLKQLSKNYKLSIVTNKRAETTLRLIKSYGWQDYFEYILCSDSQGKKMTKSEKIRSLFLYKSYYKKSIMIGDMLNDYNSAIENKLMFIKANYGYGKDEIWPKNIQSIEKIKELPELLDKFTQ